MNGRIVSAAHSGAGGSAHGAAGVEASPPDLGAAAFEPLGLAQLIEDIVSGVFEVDAEAMRRPTRGRAQIALARQVAMYTAHVCYGLTLTEVGQLFERDRTTVAHACSVVEQRRDDPSFDRAMQLLDVIFRVLAGPQAAGVASRQSLREAASPANVR